MRKSKSYTSYTTYILVIMIIFLPILLCSCWNYREIEQLAVVLGVAVDEGKSKKFSVTAEVVKPAGGPSGVAFETEIVKAEGDTIFDAVRDLVPVAGRKLYWSHAKIILISEEIASSDIIPVLDWVNRDAETREDMRLLVSREEPGNKILKGKTKLIPSVSLHMEQTLRAQKSLSRFPDTPLYKFIKDMSSKSVEPILPTVFLDDIEGEKVPRIYGTAIFKHNKLVGYFDHTDSKNLLWLRDELKGGLFTVKNLADTGTDVTLEIFGSKTKVKTVMQGDKLGMKVDIKVDAGIAEMSSSVDFISDKGRGVLKAEAKRQIEDGIKATIKKAQEEYNSDVFGFGSKIMMQEPKVWKSIEQNWDEIFPELNTNISVDIHIKGSATTRLPIKGGK